MKPAAWQTSDLTGAARLTVDAVTGVTDVVEAMHARIAALPSWPVRGHASPPRERTRGITGWVYRAVRGVTRAAGGGAEVLVNALGPLLLSQDRAPTPHARREALLAALNGVVGDRLAEAANPLAIDMSFRHGGRSLPLETADLRALLPRVTPRLLVLVHGLCMNDLQWQRAGHDHGQALAQCLGYTPVYLHYNTGLSISDNGRQLAALMERLCDAWPLPLEQLSLIGHSMGGLVARSALHHAAGNGGADMRWLRWATDLVCLGTPHLGAPLERAGHGVDVLLGAAPYASPLARLGQVRSAGIQDLRWGRVSRSGSDRGRNGRVPVVPLPSSTRNFAVAASLGAPEALLKARLLGDGLVTVASALGQDRHPERCLNFPADRTAVIARTGHLDLLSSAEVFVVLQRWLR